MKFIQKAFGSGMVGTTLTNCVTLAIGLAASILLSRWLGPGGRGELAAVMLWPSLLVALASTGMMSSVVYVTAAREADVATTFSTAVAIALPQSLLGVGLGYVALPLVLSHQSAAVVQASRGYLLSIPLILVTQYGLGILQGQQRFAALNTLRSVLPFGYLGGIVALAFVDSLHVLDLIVWLLALNALVLVLTVTTLRMVSGRVLTWPERSLGRRMLGYGAKVQLGDASQLANLRLDQTVMAAWLAPAQLGIYVAALSAANVTAVLSNAMRSVATPRIAAGASAPERARLLLSTCRAFVGWSVCGNVALALLIPVVLPRIFGEQFREAIAVAEILLVANFLVGLKDILAGASQAFNDPWLASRAEICGAVVTMALLGVALPRWGVIGAAVTSVAAYATVLMLMAIAFRRRHQVSLLAMAWRSPADAASAAHAGSLVSAHGPSIGVPCESSPR